jgi:hypothetical protein
MMNTRSLFAAPLVFLAACHGNPENNAACGFASMAAASMIVQSLQDLSHVVNTPPADVPAVLPGKVVAHGTSRVTAARNAQELELSYTGDAFPTVPGFGLLLVDDSSEAVRGVMIFEPDPPKGYPKLGTIGSGTATLPLFGIRVHWADLNAPRCPMFQPVGGDSTAK